MNREILRIALPNIVSNITVPLMGIVSTAIAGHWGADSAATIGALAIGVSIFNFIYWNCSFVRMGNQSKDWSLRWSHSQDAKANPYSTFSASVDISSSNNNYYNSTSINDIANQRKQSSISWSKKWPEKPFSLTAAFSHNQNSRDSSISVSFPNVNFRMTQIYPLRKKGKSGNLKWYDNIGISYTAEIGRAHF